MSSGPWQEPPGNTWRLNRGFGQDHQACGRILLCRALPSAPFAGCHTELLAVNSPCRFGGCNAGRRRVRMSEKCQSMSSYVLTRQDCLFS